MSLITFSTKFKGDKEKFRVFYEGLGTAMKAWRMGLSPEACWLKHDAATEFNSKEFAVACEGLGITYNINGGPRHRNSVHLLDNHMRTLQNMASAAISQGKADRKSVV